MDTKRLILLMRMTESDNDGEALNALRHANRMLKAAGKHWGDLLGEHSPPDYRTPPSKRGTGGPSRYGRPASQRPRHDDTRHASDDIEPMLSALGEDRHDVNALMMLAGIRDFWERNGFLTTPQYETIKNMHDRRNRGGSRGGFRF